MSKPRGRARRSPLRSAAYLLGALALAGMAALAVAAWLLQERGIAPRTLGPYLARRSAGHNPLISTTGTWLQQVLTRLDRGAPEPLQLPALVAGAQPEARAAGPGSRRLVASADELRRALAAAQPGDLITLLPGVYRFENGLAAGCAGSAAAPITVRAEQPGSVLLEFAAVEGFAVGAPWWRFENLSIRGVCANHGDCEHAFHVSGGAHHFAAVNNTITDFNAHFKINGSQGAFPDNGLIQSNTLTNTVPRRTVNPVTPIDLVAASDWIVRGNLITDFIKDGGDGVSYGAFAKGAGARTLFERNVVVCEQRLQGFPGQRVGLSFGGGATGKAYCREGKCITEQDGGTMRANLIASCSDVGIYLNSAAGSTLADNTLVDTAGVLVRFPASSATLDGNLVDGAIVSRDGGLLREGDNLSASTMAAYAGYHGLRRLFSRPQEFDFGWREVPRRAGGAGTGVDLCAPTRSMPAVYGAFDDFRACLRQEAPSAVL
ncbi:right-handed parallel beta-helix repeat-containing protein [Massilia sp. LXY-6]|uniref:right-handed parallel beta-helix repeat-containing protein n=1 Tax=Massilia sp. LXY-6 TaxID=3379823 RepID=UPI003EE38E2B